MAAPNTPVVASPNVPPPAFNLPFVHPGADGQFLLTPTAIEFLQTLWASIQGQGGIVDVTILNNTNPGAVQGAVIGLINEAAAQLTLLSPPVANEAAARQHTQDVALLLSRPQVPDTPANAPVLNETPTGAINGINVTYTLAHIPTSAGILLFQNGLLKAPTTNYTLAGNTITMVVAPVALDVLLASYQW